VTMAQVEEMRRLAPTKTQDELAAMFDTSRGNVQFILSGKTKLKVLGLERQRILTALHKSSRPMSVQEVKVAARLATFGSANSLMKRMLDSGEIFRAARGLYSCDEPNSAR
jgi:hypothetical protein